MASPLRAAARRLDRALSRDPLVLELLSGVGAVAWSVYVALMPLDFEARDTYRPLAALLSDEGWHWTVKAAGVVQVVAALADHRWLRCGANALAAGLWLTIGSGIYRSSTSAPGAVPYAVVGLVSVAALAALLRHRGHEWG